MLFIPASGLSPLPGARYESCSPTPQNPRKEAAAHLVSLGTCSMWQGRSESSTIGC